MTVPQPSAAPSPSTQLTMMAASMAGAIPLLALVLWFVLGSDGLGEYPASWVAIVIGVVALGAYSVSELVGFRAAPLAPGGTPAEVGRRSWTQFTSSTMLRLAVCEATFLVGMVHGFVVDSYWPVLIGLVLGLPLLLWEAWPGARNRGRFAAALEHGGAKSYLNEYAEGRL